MCLGIPARIVAISHLEAMLAIAEVDGIRREVNVACVAQGAPEALVGRWVLLHVGFAMSLIDEQQARETLSALEAMQALAHEQDDFRQLQRTPPTDGSGEET